MKNNPNRSLILNTARKLFYQQGYKNTSIRMIASELKMSNVNLFNYFKNKREMLAVLFDDFFDSMYYPLNEIRDEEDHPVETILLGIYIFHYMLSYSKRYSALFDEALGEDIIVSIFVKNLQYYFRQIADEYSQQKISDKELLYDIHTFFESMMTINSRVTKKELSFLQDFLRSQHVRLFYRLFYLNKHEFEAEEKRALEISKKYDYRTINTYWTTEWINYDPVEVNS